MSKPDLYSGPSWRQAWQQPSFRARMIAGALIMICIAIVMPSFFDYIEKREGVALHDWVLHRIPATNVSLFISLAMWSAILLGAFRAIRQPLLLQLFLWSFILLTVTRLVSISLVALNPPLGIIPLTDPLANAFYGRHFVSKDLFYSGHTSIVFLLFLCLDKKADKIVALVATLLVGILVMVQHIHYTVDVLFAPVFTLLCFYGGKMITRDYQKASPSWK